MSGKGRKKDKKIVIGITLIILVIALYLLSSFNNLLFIGGTVTSLSYVNISSYPGIGKAWIASITLNGQGQNLTSFSVSQINSSQTGTTPVSINTQVTNYGYLFNYVAQPNVGLYIWNTTYFSNSYSSVYFNYNCPLGFTCSQSFSSNNKYDYFTAIYCADTSIPGCNPSNYQQVLPDVEASYASSCYSVGGYPILVNTDTLQVNSGTYAATFACVKIYSTPYARIYIDNTFDNKFNATVTVSNQTFSHTLYINDLHTSAGYSNKLYVSKYQFSPSGVNINQQNTPTVLYLINQNKYILVNPISTYSGLSNAESSTLPSGTLSYATSTQGGTIYSNQTLININNLNQQIYSFTYQPLNNVYQNMDIASFSDANPIAILNLTNTPTFYAVIQVVANYSTLGISIPQSKPTILSVSNNNNLPSAQTETLDFNVQNSGSSGSVYIYGNCGGSSFSSSTSPTYIYSGQTQPVQVTITTQLNSGTTALQNSCVAYAVSEAYTSPAFYFTSTVNTQCSFGYIYVNSQCQPVNPQGGNNQTTTCRSGYTFNSSSNKCVQNQICPVNDTEEISTSGVVSCIPITQPQGLGLGWYIFGGIIVVGILLYAVKTKKGVRK